MEHIFFDTKLRKETITENCRLNDTIYNSWKALNIGTAPVEVYGVPLQPGEGLQFDLEPEETWKDPIEITVQPGGAVRLLRKIVTPYVKDIKRKER